MPAHLLPGLLIFLSCAHALRLTVRDASPKVMIVTVVQGMNMTSARNDANRREVTMSNFGGETAVKANRDCYAKLHGYETYTLTTGSETLDLPKIMQSDGHYADSLREVTDPRWMKVRVLKKLMADRPDIEWFIWVDGDAVIVDYHRSLDGFLQLADRRHHVIIPSKDHGCLWTSNHFYIRNSDVGHAFLDRWFDMLHQGRRCIFSVMFHGCSFGEQCHMWQAVTDYLDELGSNLKVKSHFIKDSATSKGCSTQDEVYARANEKTLYNATGPLGVQLDRALATLACRSGSDGLDCAGQSCQARQPNNDHRYAGPFVFAAHDYLIHDCNPAYSLTSPLQARKHAAQVRGAFILHKPRAGCGSHYARLANPCV